MTNHTTIDFDTVNDLEYTRAALRALSRMMGALMAQGDGIELYAIGYEVLLDTQEQRLAQIEEVMRADVASRKKSILETAPKNPQRKAPIQVDEARFEQIDAEMKLKARDKQQGYTEREDGGDKASNQTENSSGNKPRRCKKSSERIEAKSHTAERRQVAQGWQERSEKAEGDG